MTTLSTYLRVLVIFSALQSVLSWSIDSRSRREIFGAVGQTFIAAIVVPPLALAAAPPTKEELAKIQRGHARVQYLLENWNSITKVCGTATMSDTERKQVIRTEGGGGTDQCERTPLKVQDYMGYKSTEDPLYRADKLMVRAASLVDAVDFENYLDVVERYKDKSDQTALLAYTSSWGEANPNGGKEVIEDYLEQTKDQVIESEKLLRQALQYLHLEVLPPSGNKK
jgi:hypothetical protein